jgi:hypothetical protein
MVSVLTFKCYLKNEQKNPVKMIKSYFDSWAASFCKILNLKIAHLKEIVDQYFHLISTIVFLAGPSKVKNM